MVRSLQSLLLTIMPPPQKVPISPVRSLQSLLLTALSGVLVPLRQRAAAALLALMWLLPALALAQAPTITSFTPASGPAGTTVTITGTNLATIKSVVLRGIPCNMTAISATSASFVVPAQASTGRFRLTTATGNALSGTDLAVTRASASLTYQLRSNAFNGIDVGDYSTPTFTDLDHDGLLDLLVGRELDGLVAHYEQSAANSTSFTLRSTNLSGLGGHYNSLVSVTDIDGDGLLELVVGSGAGNFKHYEQTALNSFAFTELANDFNSIFSNGGLTYQYPHFTDVDGDGLLDLLVGDEFLSRYEQTAANGGIFTQLNNQNFGPTPDAGNGGSASCVVDLDGDGLLDMLVGRANGQLFHHAQASAGSASFPAVSAAFSGLGLAGYTTPAIADLDGDGLLDLLVGGSDGVLRHYEQVGALITSFAPASGPVGTSITITGTNLGSATAASVNGTAGTITGTPTATSLTFVVGAGSTTGAVSLATPGGPASSGTSFTVLPPPVLTGLSPTRNARNAATGSNVAFTFDQAMSGAASSLLAVKVFSSQRGGRLQNGARGVTTASGNTLTFDPATDFKPGETVYSTVTTAAQSSGGAVLAAGRVQQFTTAVGGSGRGTFVAPATNANPAVGANPFAVALGDVDVDGDLDFIAANNNSGTVSVRLNDGSGSFAAPVTNPNPAVGSSPVSVAVGDVDGDGDLDFIAANNNANTVSVRLNDGSGSFAAPATNPNPAVGSNPYGVALGDVDGDGDLDLLTANIGAGTVSVRLNNGNGSFGGGSNLAVGSQPISVAVADVDGDGDLDLLTANYNAAGTVSVRLNDGTGNFGGGSDPAVGNNPYSVALGDADGDGDLDFITANANATGTVSVRLNDGTGSFAAPATNPNPAVGSNPVGVALGDLDGDGDLDVLTANGIASGTVSVRLNLPPAPTITSFTPTTGPVGTSVTITGTNLAGATAAAVNGTAGTGLSANTATSLTFAVGAGSTTGAVSVTTPGGTATGGTFTVVPPPVITSVSPITAPVGTSVTVTGTNLGGATSVTVNGTAGTITANTATSLTFIVGAGSTTGPIGLTTPGGPATSSGNFTVVPLLSLTALSPTRNLRNAPAGSNVGFTFDQTMSGAASSLLGVKVFSSQRGGRLQNGARGATTASGSTLTFNPTNDFKPGETVFSTVTTAAASGTGAALVAGRVQQFTVATGGSGRGNFRPGSTVAAVGTNLVALALADVDNDGDLDLLTVNNNFAGTVSVRLNGGDATGSNTGVFANGSDPAVGNFPVSLVLGDVDHDGDLDLVTANQNASGTLSVRLNGGNNLGTNPGTFAGGSEVSVGDSPFGLALADVDADGDLDLLVGNSNASTVSVRLNGGDATGANPGTFAGGAEVAVGSSPQGLAVGDVDGDGDLDLLTADNGTSTVSVRLNQAAAPLPVELVAFTATAQGSAVQLAWAVASEKNSLRFDIERSADGRAFARIGEVAAQGTKTTPTAYAYLDPNPIPQPIAYYRLRQVDLDGTFAYSPVRAVKLTSSPPHHLTAFPNPARTAVAVGGAEAGALVTVTDALGRTVVTAPADASGTARLALPVGLAAGVYVVRCGGQAQRLAVE